MKIDDLYENLAEAYSIENLNKITSKLILLYKTKNFIKIRELTNKISKFVAIDEENDVRCFQKLIMLYHPDKGEDFRKQIQIIYNQNNFEKLNKFSHILIMSDIDTSGPIAIDQNIEYNPQYKWDINMEDGYSFTDSNGEKEFDDNSGNYDFEKSFFNLVKIRIYGRIDIELPTYYLEDFEDFEMAFSGLESLDGIEYCKHVKILDVSNNSLTDISNLWELNSLEELYLANNQIGYIDALSNLVNLKILDLSDNQIDDISPLFELDNLDYINLIGNPIPQQQIEILKKKGIIIISHNSEL